jgi:hypothetical protein
MAVPEAAKQALKAGRFGTEFAPGEILTAGAIGAATGGVGRLMGKSLMRLPAELATMTGAEAAIHGELPSAGDIAANAVLMGGMHAATRGFGRMVETKGRSIATYSALKQLREKLGIGDELVNLGGRTLDSEIYPAAQSRTGKVFFDPGVREHKDLVDPIERRIISWKRGGLGAEVRKEEIINTGYVAGGKYYATIELAQEAIGRAREANPPVPAFDAEFQAKLPELQAVVSPQYLAKANGFSWRPDKPNPTDGYMVGGKVEPWVFPSESYSPTEAIQFANQYRNHLANNPRLFIGGWKEPGVNKNVVLDISEHIMGFQEAVDLARIRGERAIFDLRAGQDIIIEEIPTKSGSPAYERAKLEVEKKLGPSKIYEPQATQWEQMMDAVWEKGIVGRLFPALEKLPGTVGGTQWFTGIRRALEPGFRGDLFEGDRFNQALKLSKIVQGKGAEAGIEIGQKFASLPESDRMLMGKVIRGEMKFEQLPEPLKPLSSDVVDIYYALGKRASDLGLMDKDTFFRHVGQYLPRYYSTYEYAENLKRLNIKAPGNIEIKRFLERRELPEAWREKMGEIKDPAYSAAKGIIEEANSIAFGEFADFVAKNPKWALSPERALISGQEIDPSWVKLPETPRYGNLSGKFVHPEIARELEVAMKSKSDLTKLAEQVYGLWKAGKVVTSPKTFIRNAMSNSVLAHLGGMPLWEQTYYLPRAALEMKRKGEYYQAYRDLSPGATTSFAKAELGRIASDIPGLHALPGAPTEGLWKKTGAKVIDKAGELYQKEETLFKLAKMMHSMERRGMDIHSAVKDADKWLFDYSDVTKFQERYRSALYGAPFATFTFKSLPRVVEAAAKTPWRFMVPMMMLNAMEEIAREKFGDTVKTEEGKKKLRDEWMQGKMFGVSNFPRVPVMDNFGREYYLDLTYILPWGDIAQSGGKTVGEVPGIGTVGLPGSLMPFTHPIAAQVWQQVSNYNQFTKQPIVKESNMVGKDLSDRIKQQLLDRAGFTAKAVSPTLLVDIVKGLRGDFDAMDYRGREKPTGIILADALAGLKMYPVEYSDQMQRIMTKLDPQRGKIAQEIRSRIRANTIRKDVLKKRGQSTELYDRLINEDIEQLEGLGRELGQYAEAYSTVTAKRKK